jgi:hypothetical protein
LPHGFASVGVAPLPIGEAMSETTFREWNALSNGGRFAKRDDDDGSSQRDVARAEPK